MVLWEDRPGGTVSVTEKASFFEDTQVFSGQQSLYCPLLLRENSVAERGGTGDQQVSERPD